MTQKNKIALTGSYKKPHATAASAQMDKDETITVTVRLRRKKSLPANHTPGDHLTHQNYEKMYGASRNDADEVETFAHQYHLHVLEVNLARRSVVLSGSITDMEKAFEVTLNNSVGIDGKPIRIREGEIYIPANLADIIEGVFGLDNRPAARPMFQFAKKDGQFVSHAAAPAAFTPDQLATIYGFPQADGKGETIAILELGGGYKLTDISNYFKSLGLNTPQVKTVAVDGGTNSPTTADSADGEVMLDILVAGAVSPAANIVVYFSPNTDQGFLDGITTAIHDTTNKPSVLSISWGAAEPNWTEQSLNSFNDALQSASMLGITVCVASGDQGSADGETDGKVHVDFPASSPFVLACGGTSLKVTNNSVSSETVWHDSNTSAGGGGVSDFFALPDYQSNVKVPLAVDTQFKGRGVPDVAGDADPDTGYKVIVDGQQMVIGGTSAVAPLMAGLIARMNQLNGKPVGFINPAIYSDPSTCRDITSGNNKTTSAGTGYTAGPGWDACTGLGVFSGQLSVQNNVV